MSDPGTAKARPLALVVFAAIQWLGGAGFVAAQVPAEPPGNAPVQVGPLTLAPTIRLISGQDSNVLNRDKEDDPVSDFSAKLSPIVDGWLRLTHARAVGRSQFDLYYFRQLTNLRAVDSETTGRIEAPLNRLLPYVSGELLNTRHRQNLEIDVIARRRNSRVTVGSDVRLTAKISANVFAQRSGVSYEANSLFNQTDLSRVLNHRSAAEGAAIRWALTPFTTFSMEVERDRDRFDSSTDRDSNAVQLGPSIEFNPLALVSGRASVSLRKQRSLSGDLPDFSGAVASIDLNYNMLARTRLSVNSRRQLQYSYLPGQREYVETGATATIMQRLGESWDLSGSLGRSRLAYRRINALTDPGFPDETIATYGVDLGYNLGHTRVGAYVEHRGRQTDSRTQNRGYERLRFGTSVTYVF